MEEVNPSTATPQRRRAPKAGADEIDPCRGKWSRCVANSAKSASWHLCQECTDARKAQKHGKVLA